MSPGQRGEVLEAAWWGSVGGAALLVGALLGLYVKVGLRVIGLVMAFGAGVTMMPEAVEHAGRLVGLLTVLGFAVAFFLSAA